MSQRTLNTNALFQTSLREWHAQWRANQAATPARTQRLIRLSRPKRRRPTQAAAVAKRGTAVAE
jgi:hypothetical protein